MVLRELPYIGWVGLVASQGRVLGIVDIKDRSELIAELTRVSDATSRSGGQ